MFSDLEQFYKSFQDNVVFDLLRSPDLGTENELAKQQRLPGPGRAGNLKFSRHNTCRHTYTCTHIFGGEFNLVLTVNKTVMEKTGLGCHSRIIVSHKE